MRRWIWAILITLCSQSCLADYDQGIAAYATGDYEGALKAWRPAAEAGDPRAQDQLGDLYGKGQGVTRDAVRGTEGQLQPLERPGPVVQPLLAADGRPAGAHRGEVALRRAHVPPPVTPQV